MINIDKFNIKNNFEIYQNMNDVDKKEYISLYTSYSNLLLKYIFEKYDLYKYDKMFKDYYFEPIDEDDYDIYQELSKDFSKYLYLRNDLYIERLSDLEKEYLKNKTNDDLDEEARLFIEKTFNKVVLENSNENYNIFYGPNNSRFIKPCNALVFGFRYDEFNKKENESDEQWADKHHHQLFTLDIIASFIHDKINNDLNIPVEVIKYNNQDVKKKNIVSDNNFIVK